MKQFLTPGLILCMSVSAVCQDKSDSDQLDDFNKGRNQDFTKLIGGIQEGVRVQYNADKSNLEYSGVWNIGSHSTLLQTSLSVGTTTNLTSLFEEDVLPANSFNGTIHQLIRPLSIWYYDAEFTTNGTSIANNAIDITTIDTRSGDEFSYRSPLREKVLSGKLNPVTQRFYTARSFVWISGSIKYDYSKYTFFNEAVAFAEQISNPRFDAWSAKIMGNYYMNWNHTDAKWKWWKPRFVYVTAGIQRGLANNVQQLKKKTIHDVKSQVVDPATNTTRQVVETTSAYTGTYHSFKCWTPQLEIIYSPVKSVAIDLFGEAALIDSEDKKELNIKSFTTLAAGVYFYGDGEKSKINIGVFYKWVEDKMLKDWTGTLNLKTAIPIVPY